MDQDEIDRSPDMLGIQDADATHEGFGDRIRHAVFWRSGGQIITQIVSWASTIAVMRILDPADYGLFAMSQVVLVFAQFLNGYGLTSALVQSPTLSNHQLRQALGLMLLLNGALCAVQFLCAPLVGGYYRQPIVADMLQVQAFTYLATPLIAIPEVLMARSMNFKKPALVGLVAAAAAALTALAGALLGWGVWTLVIAPMVGFYVRGIGYLIVTRFLPLPSLDFRGTGWMIAFGASLIGSQLFIMIQTQTDIIIGGRILDSHALGLYAEALFITQIFVGKFLPPLTDVAFPAFARMQGDRAMLNRAFSRASQLILLIACPLYLGMAVTAGPLVETLLGDKWLPMAPLVSIIALCMPFYVLQQLLNPALNAIGRPGLIMRIAAYGAVIMPIAYLLCVRAGAVGLAWAWAAGIPVLAIIGARIAGRAMGLGLRDFAAIMGPGLLAAIAMAFIVHGVDILIPDIMPAPLRLALLVLAGAAAYGTLLWLFARAMMRDVIDLLRRKPPVAVGG
jgi:O-antigen/teichoic acid export membrane protein